MASSPIHVPDTITETALAYAKPIRGRFNSGNVTTLLKAHYSEDQIAQMRDKGVDQRMVFGVNAYYAALVQGEEFRDVDDNILLPAMPPSRPLEALVIPVLAEASDMSGEVDPSNQNTYSPDELKGKMLHKYDEIVLGYVALACSAHCRYCYRLDLFNGSTGKGLVKPEELRDYIIAYNRDVALGEARGQQNGEPRYPVREVLLSGGDPMVLTNRKLYAYMAAAAEAGVDLVRIGTKEMAFRPMRFDENMVLMLQAFHANYPHMHVNIVTHFSHPDEMLLRDEKGAYVHDGHGLTWLTPVAEAVRLMTGLPFVSLENQTPIIARVNDDVKSLHLLHAELRRMGIGPKYLFQCRNIEGHSAFAIPVEQAWHIHNDAMKGLSDAARSRFSMSTEWGKMEVVTVIDGVPTSLLTRLPSTIRHTIAALFSEGLVVMRMHRSPYSAHSQGDVIIARRNHQASWMCDYEDRIIYDGRQKGAENKYAPLIESLLDAHLAEIAEKQEVDFGEGISTLNPRPSAQAA